MVPSVCLSTSLSMITITLEPFDLLTLYACHGVVDIRARLCREQRKPLVHHAHAGQWCTTQVNGAQRSSVPTSGAQGSFHNAVLYR